MADLLPPNATPQERALAETVSRSSEIFVPVRDTWNPDTCPAVALPWLAWALSVDEWDSAWSEEQKREAIKSSIAVHEQKGTIGAVKEALAALGYGVQVQEWFEQEPPAAPYTFSLVLDVQQSGIEQGGLAEVLSVVNATKNLRSHLGAVTVGVTSLAQVFAASCVALGNEITLTNYVAPAIGLMFESGAGMLFEGGEGALADI